MWIFRPAASRSKRRVMKWACPPLVMQPTLRHRDARLTGHPVIGVLDSPVSARIGDFAVPVVCNSIELENPGLVSLRGIDLAGAKLTR